jgi:hypothetical protein
MPTTYLPHEHHVARYIRSGLLIRDEDKRVIGVHPPAFFLKPATATRAAEKNLSIDWMEHYGGEKAEQLRQVARHAELKLKPTDAYGVLQVGVFSDACAKKSRKVRIIYEPTAKNPAHSAVHQYPPDDFELATVLASIASQDLTQVREIEDSRDSC